jgi:hypothetical protein
MKIRLGYPADVREALAQILEIACLSIRVAARKGDARYCAIEADHIHNLPALLRKFDATKLKYYLDVTRPIYVEALSKLPGTTLDPYQVHWRKLEAHAA